MAGNGENWIIGGPGSDTIVTGEGRNFILGDLGSMTFAFDFGVGVNWLTGMRTSFPHLRGPDLIQVGTGRNHVLGGGSNDKVVLGGESYLILGGGGLIFRAGNLHTSELIRVLEDRDNPVPPLTILDGTAVEVTEVFLELLTGTFTESAP